VIAKTLETLDGTQKPEIPLEHGESKLSLKGVELKPRWIHTATARGRPWASSSRCC
jgi:hypothetical protein